MCHKGARRHDSTIDRSKSTIRRAQHETLHENICLTRNADRVSDRPGKCSCVRQLGQLRRHQRHRRDRQRLRDRASRHHQKRDQRRLRIESKFRHTLSWRRRALRSADHRRSVRWRRHGDWREGDLQGQLCWGRLVHRNRLSKRRQSLQHPRRELLVLRQCRLPECPMRPLRRQHLRFTKPHHLQLADRVEPGYADTGRRGDTAGDLHAATTARTRLATGTGGRGDPGAAGRATAGRQRVLGQDRPDKLARQRGPQRTDGRSSRVREQGHRRPPRQARDRDRMAGFATRHG